MVGGVKVNIGEQREFRLASCPDIVLDVATSLRMSAGAMILRTGSQSVHVHRPAPVMVLMVLTVIQLYVDEIGMCRIPPLTLYGYKWVLTLRLTLGTYVSVSVRSR